MRCTAFDGFLPDLHRNRGAPAMHEQFSQLTLHGEVSGM